jgi:hypothetical protein
VRVFDERAKRRGQFDAALVVDFGGMITAQHGSTPGL